MKDIVYAYRNIGKEGDPSTFDMTLNVLRSTNDAGEQEMMKLVRYNI